MNHPNTTIRFNKTRSEHHGFRRPLRLGITACLTLVLIGLAGLWLRPSPAIANETDDMVVAKEGRGRLSWRDDYFRRRDEGIGPAHAGGDKTSLPGPPLIHPLQTTAKITVPLELVGQVPSPGNFTIGAIEAIQVRDDKPYEIVFATQNQGASCGAGTPAAAWKMTLDPDTGVFDSVEVKQSLSGIQVVRGDLFENSAGVLFTGGGWCGSTPPYYSTDGGETWRPANKGTHPPNSTFSYVEFKEDVYAGTGYEPVHGQVYRWLGDQGPDHWELVLDIPPPRSIVDTMAVYENRLFIGSQVYWSGGAGCSTSTPVYVSPDGHNFEPTAGIPPCYSVNKLVVAGDQLVAQVQNYFGPERAIYHWDDAAGRWQEAAAYYLGNGLLVSLEGALYAYGRLPGDPAAGVYRSVDAGQSWGQIAVLEKPDVLAMTTHENALYFGTYAAPNGVASIYKIVPDPPPALTISKIGPAEAMAGVPIAYTLRIANNHSVSVANVIITDTVPRGAGFVEALEGGQLVDGQVVRWTIPELAANHSAEVHFVVTATHPITNDDYVVSNNGLAGTPGQVAVVTTIIEDSGIPSFDDPTGTSSVVAGDIDNDGHLDLVAGTSIGEPNVVYLNDGLGDFPTNRARRFGTGSEWTTALAVGDLNRDGTLDIIVGNNNEQNVVYLNDGLGDFPMSLTRPFGGGDRTTSVAVGDLDGDGALDIIVGNENEQNMVYLNDGAANFDSAHPFGPGADDTRSVAIGDVNGDDHLDIAVGNYGEQNIVYLNDGSLTPTFALTRPFSADEEATTHVTIGDANNDGALDLIAGNESQQNVVYLNDGAGYFSFSADDTIDFGAGSDKTLSVAAADVNDDGLLDFISGNLYQSNLVELNNDIGAFVPHTVHPFGGLEHTTAVAAGDINADGALDLVAGNDGQNVIYLNDGLTFTPHNFGSVDSTHSIAAADVDGDHDLDLVAGNTHQNVVYLNNNTSPPTFTAHPLGSDINGTASMAVGDVNGDGPLDLIAGNLDGANMVYLNDGAGDFDNGRSFGPETDNTESVAVGDMNGDGALDIVVGNRGPNAVYLNDGLGEFPPDRVRPFGLNVNTHGVAVGDINADGYLDIVAGNRNQPNEIYLNDGAGNFSKAEVPAFSGVADSTLSVAVADINGDGALDIVVGNNDPKDTDMVYLNDGQGDFYGNNTRPIEASFLTEQIAVGDVNGDGTLDIVTGRSLPTRFI